MVQSSPPLLRPPLLLATDGSESARLAQKLLYPIARLLAPAEQGHRDPLLTILHVQPRLRRKHPAGADSLLSERSPVHNGNGAEAHRIPPSLWIDMDFPANLSVNLQVRQGRPAIEILQMARTLQAGLLAVGQRGTGGVRELVLGSVSATVARYAPCSVLVARHLTSERKPNWRHILLAVNDSLATQTAIAFTRQLIPAGIEQITLLHVQPPLTTYHLFGPFTAGNPSWQWNQSLQQVQKEQSDRLLEQARAGLDLPSSQIQVLVQTGEPGPTICQVAQQQQVDLVIMGNTPARRLVATNRRPVLRPVHLSATGDYVLHHAPCPVLLCRIVHPATDVTRTR